jgi:dTDP-4-amino-4,6-dideoxygalactose transaminase
METLRALIRGDLSPAGYPISTLSSSIEDNVIAGNYVHYWVDSGTSALALALTHCRSVFSNIHKPQVIIPGYCCPDLVAAAVFAGVQPLVVDIAENDASYDLHQLKNAINNNPNVIAIIAVNFLGIKENLANIRELMVNRNIKLIEDNAQWFPVSEQDQDFLSDYLVFSFGRGKPLSLLGGGLLLSKDPLTDSITESENVRSGSYKLKIYAYNFLLHPHAYCFLNRAPFLKLGETRFHSLDKIASMPLNSRVLFSHNRQLYIQREEDVINQYQQWFSEIQLLKGVKTERKGRLLRYPLLLGSQIQRDKIFKLLQSNGLGVSLMYQQELNQIEGVDGKVNLFAPLTHAKSFARRLITLPIHTQVGDKHLKKIKGIILNNL